MQSACLTLYCRLWPALLYNIFSHYLTNSTMFGKKVTEHKMCEMCVLSFSVTFLWKTSHSTQNSVWYYHKCTQVFMKVPITLVTCESNVNLCERLKKKKLLKYQLSLNSVQWKPSCSDQTDGQTDRQADMKKLTVTSYNFMDMPKNS